jgi:hypothetical protein
MAFLDTSRIAWTYTADDGTVYRVAAVKALTDQAQQGGASGAAIALSKPGNLKMRRVTCRTAGGVARVFPLYEGGAPLATAGTTINANVDGVSTSFISRGNPLPEGHIRRSVTEQTT